MSPEVMAIANWSSGEKTPLVHERAVMKATSVRSKMFFNGLDWSLLVKHLEIENEIEIFVICETI